MKLIEMLDIAHQAYPTEEIKKTFQFWNGQVPSDLGDLVAEFIMIELQRVYRVENDELTQTFEALKALRNGRDALDRVVNAFSARHQAALQRPQQAVVPQGQVATKW